MVSVDTQIVRFEKLVENLQHTLVDGLARGKGEGWQWELDSLIRSHLHLILFKPVYYAVGENQTFNDIFQQGCREGESVYRDKDAEKHVVNLPIEILDDLSVRTVCLARLFTSPAVVDECIKRVGGDLFIDSFGIQLKNNAAYAETTRNALLNHIGYIGLHDGIGKDAYREIIRRWKKNPAVVQKMIGIAIDSDAARRNEHFRETLSHLKRITHQYRLPADYDENLRDDDGSQYRDEKAGVLQGLIAQQISPLQEMDWRSRIGWIEKNGQRLIPNIFQGLQQTFRKQYAQKRQPDVIANREYTDAENEDGRTVGDLLTAEHLETFAVYQPEITEPIDSRIQALNEKVGTAAMQTFLTMCELTREKEKVPTNPEIAEKRGVSVKQIEKDRKNLRKAEQGDSEVLTLTREIAKNFMSR